MPRKISPHAELPSYQIFWQKRGDRHPIQPLVELYDERDVRSVMAMLKQHERKYGKQVADDKNGGFIAYTGPANAPTLRAAYWAEEIMPDEAFNREDTPLSEDLWVSISLAMVRGAISGRAKREAAAAGLNFEPGDGE